MDLVNDRGSMKMVHGPLVHVLSSPVKVMLNFIVSTETFIFSDLTHLTHKTSILLDNLNPFLIPLFICVSPKSLF